MALHYSAAADGESADWPESLSLVGVGGDVEFLQSGRKQFISMGMLDRPVCNDQTNVSLMRGAAVRRRKIGLA